MPVRAGPVARQDRLTACVKEYQFVLGHGMARATFARAVAHAHLAGVAVHTQMLAEGTLSEADYVRLLAAELGLQVFRQAHAGLLHVPEDEPADAVRVALLANPSGGEPAVVVDGTAYTPSRLRRLVDDEAQVGSRILIAAPATLRRAMIAARRPTLVARAVNGLRRLAPDMSAASGIWTGQAILLAAIAGVEIGAFMIVPTAAVTALAALLTAPFFVVTALRLIALFGLGAGWWRAGLSGDGAVTLPRLKADRDLPVYTVLCPLFREAAVLPQLVRALTRLDYPAGKLDIKLVLEEADHETIAVARGLRLPSRFEIVVVPDCHPRTKPKALDYALQFARGSYAVIYDAEDIPEPDQLRRAVAAFAAHGDEVACLQARLVIHNPGDGWLAGQFAIEYAALFDALLPAFARLDLPLPLGGTSNHFPVALLRRIGGWDAHNMTEDADLGVRLSRHGYRAQVLDSATYEEAPVHFAEWLRQRTRWFKGWMQTYIVHTRRPLVVLRQLGVRRFVGFHAIIGGFLLAALVHPIFIGYVVWHMAGEGHLAQPQTAVGATLWGMAIANILVGYTVAMLLGVAAAAGRGRWGMALQVPLIPLYWLVVSLAAYRALVQLFTSPFTWEKTSHGKADTEAVFARIAHSGAGRGGGLERRSGGRAGSR